MKLLTVLVLLVLLTSCQETKAVKHAYRQVDTTISTRWVALSQDGTRCGQMYDSVAVGDSVRCTWTAR